MQNLLVQDVCEVYIKDQSVGGKVYFFGLTTKTDITQKVKQDMIRGGIGNGIAGLVQSEKELTFKVSTLFHNDAVYEIQSGTVSSSGSVTVQKNEQVQCTEAGKLTITGTPKAGTTPLVLDALGGTIAGTWTTTSFTATQADKIAVGTIYTVVYSNEATGEILTLDGKKFPQNYYVELHTIAYSPSTNKVVADLYWTFTQCLPDGGITASLEAGKNVGDEISFTAMMPIGSSEYGKYCVIPRT